MKLKKPHIRRSYLRKVFIAAIVIYAAIWAPTVFKVKISSPTLSAFLMPDADPCAECFNMDTSIPCSLVGMNEPWCQRYMWMQHDLPASKNLSIPASKDALIFDVNCRHLYRYDYYHFLFDCSVPLMPVLGLMQRQEKLHPPSLFVAVHNRPLHDVIAAIFKNALDHQVVHMNSRTPTKDTVKYENRETITMMPSDLSHLYVYRNASTYTKCSPCFRYQTHKAFGVQLVPVTSADKILVLWRDPATHGRNAGGRAILDHDYLVNELVGKFGDRVVVHYGNETTAQTVKLFGSSSVVIGYHGAGMVNSLFMRKGSLVIEITTFTDRPETGELKIWRANMPAVYHGLGVDYSLHLVEHHHLIPSIPDEVTDWDHTLKPSNVVLGREHVFLVLEKTERFLASLDVANAASSFY